MDRMKRFLSWGLIIVFVFGLAYMPGGKVQAAPSTGAKFTVSVTTLGSTYTQNFDTLANTGTTNTWTDDITPLVGWYAAKAVAPNNIITYRAGIGDSNTGALYSFGSAASTERALGSVSSGTPSTINYGVQFTNNTSSTITSLDISYTGEQWRNGGNASAQTLAFSYQVGATSLILGTWTSFTALDFVTPTVGATTAPLVGNATENRTPRSSSIVGLAVVPGGTIWLRWMDINDSGNDHGVAIDDLSVTPQGGVSTNPSGSGSANPGSALAGDTTLLTIAVTPGTFPTSTGLAVSCDLSAIGGLAPQAFFDDGTNGDVTSGDNTFSFSTTIAGGTATGAKSLTCTIDDNEGRPGSTTVGLTVIVILPIGTVQGVVNDSDDGTLVRSPYAPPSGTGSGQTVVVQGVIYEKTLQAIKGSTNSYYGFFIQNTAATADTEPNTSDGLFVFMSTTSTISGPGGTTYTPAVGDEVILTGTISEYYYMTELSNPTLIRPVIRSGVDLEAELSPFVANPPVSLVDANRYWERRESMRGQVPLDSIVLGGRNVFSPADAEIWVAAPDSTIAMRIDPYTRRAFRDAHTLDDNYDATNWDGNGYRILIGSLGIKATLGDAQALIAPARTFDTVTNAPVGGLNYTYSKYRIEITEQPTLSNGVNPAANNPPQNFDRSLNYSIADYNLENLYDYRDNPFSGCDFARNAGCPKVDPFLAAIYSPFDYVPASDDVYQARLNDIAHQIIDDLHSPDILMLQEVENQDICSVVDGSLACGDTNNADGQPDVLQDLALKVASLGGPAYQSAFDRDSSDLRGILPAFMYRSDRVELAPAAGDPLLGGSPVIDGYTAVPYDSDISNPKTLNAVYTGTGACETNWVFPRAPDIALFRIYSESVGVGSYRDVYAVNNHFKSGPDSCVAHRTEQAKYNAAIVAFLESVNPNALVVVGGDLNVYPRPDDIAYGASDQLGSLYDPGLGLTNLWEVLLGDAPASAYSYVYLGMAQTLDQMFITGPMLADLREFRIAHINSDFPADYPDDVARGTSDHDPNVATFAINFSGFFPPIDNPPALNEDRAGSSIPVKFRLGGDKGLDIFAGGAPQSGEFACDTGDTSGTIFEPTYTAGSSGLKYDPLTDQYTYIWKTDKSWLGTCRQLMVTLNDGTVQLANFQFK